MRILMSTDAYPGLDGGASRVAYEIANRAVAWGHEVAVLTLDHGDDQATTGSANGVQVFRAKGINLTRLIGLHGALSLEALPLANRLIKEFRPTVVNVHTIFFITSFTTSLAARMLNTPCITTMHIGALDALPLSYRAISRLYELTAGRIVLRNSRAVIAVSAEVARHAQHLTRDRRPVKVIPNGVDSEHFAFRPPENAPRVPTISFVGRLMYNKGAHYLIDAMPMVLTEIPEARVMIIGDGPMRARLQVQTDRLGVRKSVEFLGMRHDINVLLRESTVFARPSLTEGMPLAVLEAMSTGLPVVATRVAGVPEIVQHGHNGLLVEPGDVGGLAKSLVWLLRDAEAAAEMGARGREMVEGYYSWERVADETLKFFEEVSCRA